jgi:two-component system, chemotaxis family, chemotaxis protein CheY
MEILIVDDDRLSRMLLRAMLKKSPEWNLTEAGDGQAAWDMLTVGLVVDLVLTDIVMPRLTGVELLKRIRGDERFKNLHVIMSTAVTTRNMIEEVGKLGADYYLLKPVNGDILRDQIRRVENALSNFSSMEDPATAQKRLGIDEPTYYEFLKLLSQDIQASLTTMRNAAGQSNQSQAEYSLNSLGGTATNLGLSELSHAILAAEQATKNGDASTFSSCLNRVETETQRIATILSKREQTKKPAPP